MRLLAGAATLLIAASLAALAQAQDGSTTVPDPCTAVNESSPGSCDSEYTPQAREGAEISWSRIAGAQFGEEEAAASPTPISVDFFAADFRATSEGFFAGAGCDKPEAGFAELGSCERVPVIYRYSVPPGQDAVIEPVFGPERSDSQKEPGYVASVAWIGKGRAIAVGGTGHYPRRELPWCPKQEGEDAAAEVLRCKDVTEADYIARDLAGEEPNAAGRARVWLYSDGRWRELGEDDLPQTAAGEPMAGLTTVECTPRPTSDGELCWAGGMRQIWRWQDGAFGQSFTPTSVDGEGNPTVDDGANWHFRVRSLRFNPDETVGIQQAEAFGVTSGCCAANELGNSPRLLLFDGVRWYSRLLVGDRTGVGLKANNGLPDIDADPALNPLRPRQSLPDSYYSLFLASQGGGVAATVLASPGGPPPDAGQPGAGEPVSQLISTPMSRIPDTNDPTVATSLVNFLSPPCASTNPYKPDLVFGHTCTELVNPNLSEVRLHALDGDFAQGIDGGGRVADWAVGELRSTGRGVAFTTLRRGTLTPKPVTCYDTVFGDVINADPDTECKPRETADLQEDTRSHSLYAPGTYSLNALAATPQGEFFFAAGDKGGIARLGGEGGAAGETEEPLPERVGPRQPANLPDDQPYAGTQLPSAGGSGPVPSLIEQPLEKLLEPRLVSAGAPDPTRSDAAPAQDVSSMVLSRDGSEGWAIGLGATKTAPGSIFHYDGTRWRRCEMDGVPGLVPPNPACAELAPLQRSKSSGGGSDPTQFRAIARVPLEYDSDPSNDDEFEAVALGTDFRSADGKVGGALLRYQAGRWRMDTEGMEQIAAAIATTGAGESTWLRDVAFTAPDDGWILAYDGTRAQTPLHYDGQDWTSCVADPPACGDTDKVLPFEAGGEQNTESLFLTTAGRRLYFGGNRSAPGASASHPFIAHKDPGGHWISDLDPGCVSRDPETGRCVPSGESSDQGDLTSISVSQDAQGRYAGWATGPFGSPGVQGTAIGADQYPLLRLDPGSETWRPYLEDDAATDYLVNQNNLYAKVGRDTYLGGEPPKLLSFRGPDGSEEAVVASSLRGTFAQAEHSNHPMLSWAEGEPWGVAPTPFLVTFNFSYQRRASAASPRALAPDGQGGYWVAVRRAYDLPSTRNKAVFFYHYTDRAPRQVFSEAPHPIREPITATSPAPGGRLWAATASGAVYRYDRVMGWDRASVPGWDAGRVITRTSPAAAIAIGDNGEGVVVGEGGRIADISGGGLRLNPAAGSAAICTASEAAAPCGTGRDLLSADVASDGSAMVGGESRALLWRPAGGAFQAIPKPPASVGASITGISMPSPNRAFVVTDGGQVFRGDGPGPAWTWTVEAVSDDDDPITRNASGRGIPLRGVALDSSERGFAVGDKGLLIERTGDPERPWRRLDSGVLENLTSVALPPGGGDGALIGGQLGLILTLRDGRFEVARTDDFTDPVTTAHALEDVGRIVGIAMLPGASEGQVEAWAASQATADNARRPGATALLHFTNTPEEPLLDPSKPVEPLADAPPRSPEELELAALGRSDCHLEEHTGGGNCPEEQGTNMLNEVVQRRATDEIAERAAGHDRTAALYTGDIDFGRKNEAGLGPRISHRRWVEMTAGRFADPPGDVPGMPLFATMGVLDLSEVENCDQVGARCLGPRRFAGAGSSLPWRSAMAGMPAPWGSGEEQSRGEISFVPVEDSELTKTINPDVQDPTGALPQGGARTHYALDITDTSSGAKLARLVVLDSSQRSSITASDPNQNPVDQQLAWLQEVLCKQGSASDTAQRPCSRETEERAIVLTSTPTYSYGPGTLSDTNSADGSQFEQILFTEGVDAVISGRLGWNGLYYALSSLGGLHTPDPGNPHPDPANPPDPVPGQPKPIPFLVAAGAGGTFGPAYDQQGGSASEGYWHGYSVLRLDPASGEVYVEQRPIFDWLAIRPDPDAKATHAVRAGKRLALEGFGREAAGMDEELRYDEITTHAITHRYELLAADPDQPWLPEQGENSDGCDPYDCLDPSIGEINGTTGEVKAGNGNYPRTYAIAELSAGDKSATYPLVFEPRASYRVKPAAPAPPVAVPPPPPAPAPPSPASPSVNLPAAPVLPVLTAQALAPPPVPPAPPTFASEAPLDLNISPAALDVTPPTAVSQPPTPPVNPAPPSGARREARQRQAAAQKSGADTGDEESRAADHSQELGGDMADKPLSPQGSEMTRRHDFTALASREQPSAWARDALLGTGLGVAALIFAIGLRTARPTPRRRQPEAPAEAKAGSRNPTSR